MIRQSELQNAAAETVWINGFPAPPPPPVRRLDAVIAVLRLIRNKEDTSQVFEAVNALAGPAGSRQFERFTNTAYGRDVVKTPIRLEEILSNREALAALPEGSFGRAYLDFMVGEDLTPTGLLASAKEAGIDLEEGGDYPEYMRMFLNQTVMHDVFHVLTGYGRDALGELCNLAFSNEQTSSPGFRLIMRMGLIAQKLEAPRAPVMKAVAQGRRMGAQADYVPGHDIRELLPMPLAEVRRRLNIIEPTIYNAIPQDFKDNLLKPKGAYAGSAPTANAEGASAAA